MSTPVPRLTKQEFKRAIARRQGRALLHLRRYGEGTLRPIILDALLHFRSYDGQIEGYAPAWWQQVLRATRNEDYYRLRVLRALPATREHHDRMQMFTLAMEWARRGDKRARRTCLAAIRAYWKNTNGTDPTLYIRAYKVEGFAEVVRAYSRLRPARTDSWAVYYLHQNLLNALGTSKAMRTRAARLLAAMANRDPAVRRLLSRFEAAAAVVRKSPQPQPKAVDLRPEVIAAVEDQRFRYPGAYSLLARRASKADMQLAWARLLSEVRRSRLLRWLWLFVHIDPPQPHPRLLKLAAGSDRLLARAAVQALSRLKHPRVGALARTLGARRERWRIRHRLLGLFEHNYEPGDAAILVACVTRLRTREEVHAACLDLKQIASMNPGTELIPVFSWAFENTPCSHCRCAFLKELLIRGGASSRLLREALADGDFDTSALARAALRSAAPAQRLN